MTWAVKRSEMGQEKESSALGKCECGQCRMKTGIKWKENNICIKLSFSFLCGFKYNFHFFLYLTVMGRWEMNKRCNKSTEIYRH
jgi:hypothetical protein